MERKEVNNLSTNKEFYQFQVAIVTYMKLKQNKAFEEKIHKCLYQNIYVKASQHMWEKMKQ